MNNLSLYIRQSNRIMTNYRIAVLLFHDAELLDFAGPLQVFGAFKELYPDLGVSITIIGLTEIIRVSKLNMEVVTEKRLDQDKSTYDLLIIPGGMGTRPIVKDEETLQLIRELSSRSERIASVCTGSLILAKLGMLSGLKATTHFAATEILTKLDPDIILDRSKRFFDHDHLIIGEGVSAGIDLSFYLIEKFFDKEKSETVRKYIEYYPSKEYSIQ